MDLSVVDMAVNRVGVEHSRVALLGISFGGYFVLRATAVDDRVAAVVANSPVVDLRAYLTSFVGFDPEETLTGEEDFSIADIDTIPDEDMPPTQKEMARSLIPPLRTAELKAMSAIVHAAMPLEATWGATGGVVAGAKPLSVLGAGRADAEATVHNSVARTAAAPAHRTPHPGLARAETSQSPPVPPRRPLWSDRRPTHRQADHRGPPQISRRTRMDLLSAPARHRDPSCRVLLSSPTRGWQFALHVMPGGRHSYATALVNPLIAGMFVMS